MNELELPLDEALEAAKDIGVDYVWFTELRDRPQVAEMTDAEVDKLAEKIAAHGLEQMLISAGSPFKFTHLTDLDADGLPEHPEFRKDFDDLVRSMEIASRLGVDAVSVYSFAWPGEYTADKPTWPMRWLTRGGVIADVDMDKLVRAFSLVAEQAEKHDVDAVVSMMPWNYTNTTANFRLVIERVGSGRLKVMWGPADNYNCGEWDVATAGFDNVRPFLHSLHVKDLHVNDGLRLDFEYRPLGEGDVDYPAVLRSLLGPRQRSHTVGGDPLPSAERLGRGGHANQLRPPQSAGGAGPGEGLTGPESLPPPGDVRKGASSGTSALIRSGRPRLQAAPPAAGPAPPPRPSRGERGLRPC